MSLKVSMLGDIRVKQYGANRTTVLANLSMH